MDILRFITAGSVDDGKSTLIGRLLYDSKSILIDQLAAIEKGVRDSGLGIVRHRVGAGSGHTGLAHRSSLKLGGRSGAGVSAPLPLTRL